MADPRRNPGGAQAPLDAVPRAEHEAALAAQRATHEAALAAAAFATDEALATQRAIFDASSAEREAAVAALRAEHEAALAEASTRAQGELDALRARFDRAWAERERQLEAEAARPLPRLGPVSGTPVAMAAAAGPRVRHARAHIHCRVDGRPTVIPAGEPIPDGADLTGVAPDAIEEH